MEKAFAGPKVIADRLSAFDARVIACVALKVRAYSKEMKAAARSG